MTIYAILTHLGFGIVMVFVAILSTRLMLNHVRIMDHPDHRSSHAMPVPKSGGIAIVITFLIGIIAIYVIGDKTQIDEQYFWGFVISALAIAIISFYDDITNKSYVIKIITQAIAAIVVITFGVVITELGVPGVGQVSLGWAGYIITFIWIIGLTNAYNFMDGLDGLAAGTAVIVCVFFGIITYSQGSEFSYIACYAVAAGALGFLIFNFPPAKIFMGDVGSAFLGFVFACLAIIAARYDHSQTTFLVMPLLLFNYIYDTVFTFFRRLIQGKSILQGHKEHLYQLFNQLGYSHRTVSLFHYFVSIAQGIGAWWMVHVQSEVRIVAYLPYLIFQIMYTIVILRMMVRRRIIHKVTE